MVVLVLSKTSLADA